MQKLLIAYCRVKQGLNLFTYIPRPQQDLFSSCYSFSSSSWFSSLTTQAPGEVLQGWWGRDKGRRGNERGMEALVERARFTANCCCITTTSQRLLSTCRSADSLLPPPTPHLPFSPSTKLLLKPLPSSRYFEFR